MLLCLIFTFYGTESKLIL